jgi:hypothetical protein
MDQGREADRNGKSFAPERDAQSLTGNDSPG